MSFHLFEVFGVELEYMIVSKSDLRVQPIADQVLIDSDGNLSADVERGEITWSNELSAHVIELKTSSPVSGLQKIESAFVENIHEINRRLNTLDAMLLPGAAHPLLVPLNETFLWKHEGHEIYDCYNRLFDCRDHGWVNLQSVHLNLPFSGDQEFAALHAAVRLLLPLLPVLSASSPIIEGKPSGVQDSRLKYYLGHQRRLKSSMGRVIPEALFNEADYRKQIFTPIEEEVRSLDKEGILRPKFLNARAAIARFERGSIEIRVLDIAECPAVDLAICSFIVEVLKYLVFEQPLSLDQQMQADTEVLRDLLDRVIVGAGLASVKGLEAYQAIAGCSVETTREFWCAMYEKLSDKLPEIHAERIKTLLDHGNLSERILRQLSHAPSEAEITDIYRELAGCLEQNRMFL